MNQEHFTLFQRAADPALLEEAHAPIVRKKSYLRPILASAACLCLVLAAAAVLWHGQSGTPAQPESSAQLANPIQTVTADELAALGYALPVPEGADDVRYSTITLTVAGEAEALPLAQVTYTLDAAQYTCRAQKGTADGTDLSGIYCNWTQELSWSADDVPLTLRSNDECAVVGWYLAESDTHYSLSAQTDPQLVLAQVQAMALDLGHTLAAAPAGAESVSINAFSYDDMTIAETTFVMDGRRWVYRTAATPALTITDISGITQTFAVNSSAEVSWCAAELSFDEGGAGKILWLDIAPGLIYSLDVDTGASEALLLEMANAVFSPAQGDTE